MRRKAERKWCSSNSTHDLKEYKSGRNVSTNLIKIGRSDFWENLIQETSSDQGKLFKISKHLLNQSFDVPFPPHVSKSMLANEMTNFFVEKISNIRSKFRKCTIQDCQDCAHIMELHSLSFGSFKAITEGETYSIIMNLAKKSCALDPIPTTLLVKCIDVLLPVITKMVNISLESGHFPLAWKEALLRTILKKNGLDTVLKNYRPVSNLSFFSKVTKRAVFLQTDNHNPLDWGVPQGSCLGPLLYIMYFSKLPVFNIIERHLPNSHCYARVSLTYLSFKPDDLSSEHDAITTMQNCIDDIRSWM